MNLTLSVDEEMVKRARKAAEAQGTSLNELVREYIESLAGKRSGRALAERIGKLAEQARAAGASRREPYQFNREDAYDPKRIGRE